MKMKKILSLLTAAAVLVSSLSAVMLVSADVDSEALIYSDNFDSYSVSETPVKDKNLPLAGSWVTTTVNRWGYDHTAQASIAANPEGEGNVVMLEAKSIVKENHVKPSVRPSDLVLESDSRYRIKYDFYRINTTAGGGLRIYNGESDYYQIDVVGTGDHSYDYVSSTTPTTYSTAFIKNGTRVSNWFEESDEYKVTIINPHSTATSGKNLYALSSKIWYTVDVVVEEGSINWTITNNETDEIVQTGAYAQAGNIINSSTQLHLFAGGQNAQYTYFDNFEVYKDEGWIPMTLCANLVEGETADEDGVVTFNQTEGGYVTGINCPSLANETLGLSYDGEGYTNVTLDADGVWSPGREYTRYKYIKLNTTETPGDLLVFGDMSLQTYDVVRFASMNVYETSAGKILGTTGVCAIDDTVLASFEDGKIYGHRGGTVNVDFTSSGYQLRTAEVRVVDELTRVLDSGDPAKLATYVESQQDILDILNTAIADNDTEAVKAFFKSTEKMSFYGIDAIKTNEISELFDESMDSYDAAAEENLIQRLLTHSDGFTVAELSDLYDFENIIIREIRTDKVSEVQGIPADEEAGTEEVTAAQVLKEALTANNDILNLPLDNKYYVENNTECLSALAGRRFASYAQLKSDFTETYVMQSFKKAGMSTEYAAALIKDCEEEIGYDTEKFEDISNVSALAKALLDDTANINTLADLKTAIDDYEEPTPESDDTQTTVKTNKNKGGNGGGPSIKVTTPPVETVVPAKPVTEPVVDKAQLFDDVTTDHWSYEAIRYMVAKGAVNGYEDGTFLPDNPVTRAEFVKMAVTAAGIKVDTGDVEEDPNAGKVKKPIDLNGDGIINSQDLTEVDKNGDGVLDDSDKVTIDVNEDGVVDDADKVDGVYQYMFEYDYKYEYVEAEEGEVIETPQEEEPLAFIDISGDDWFTPYLTAAKEAGIFTGDLAGTARPTDLITKEECAAILYRLINTQGISLADTQEIIRFADSAEIADWANLAVFELQVKGIINGYNGYFGPKSNATRAESAIMLFKIMSNAGEVPANE